MEKQVSSLYHTHITASHKWYEINLKEVWQYRDLIVLFVKRNFAITYKQTVLGPAWIFLNPLVSSIIYAFVFGTIAGIGTDGVPSLLFYMCSNALWLFFSSCVEKNARTFTENAGVFGKVYFPRLTIPISHAISSVIQFGIQMLMVCGFLIYYVVLGQVHPHWGAWVLIPLVLLHLGLLGLGCGIIISSLTTKYRDLSILVTFGIQLWMYITPIVYPISQIESGLIRTVLMVNPVTAPVELLRYAVLGQGQVLPQFLALSLAVTLVVDVIGVMIFNRVEKTFMDTV